jgi:hypothetical protein
MASNLFWRFASDAGTITASSEGAQFTAAKLQDNILSNKWISDGTDNNDILTVDLGAAETVSAFGFLNHNIEAADTLTLEYASDSGFTTDTGTVTVTYNASTIIEYFTPVARRYWRFTIAKGGIGSREAGRLLLGEYYALARSMQDPGYSFGLAQTTGDKVTTDGGQIYANIGTATQMMQGVIQGLNDDEYDEIEALKNAYGEAVPFIFTAAPTSRKYRSTIYGVFSRLPRWSEYSPGIHNTQFSIMEQK